MDFTEVAMFVPPAQF